MPTLKDFERETGIKARRWKDIYQQVRDVMPVAEIKLSDWQQDYSWEGMQQAIKDGYILSPVPDGWERVRDIAEEIGGKRAVPWLLGSGERHAQIVWDAGVYDRCRMDEYAELLCTVEDGKVLRDYAFTLWNK